MDAYLLGAPAGFAGACLALNAVAKENPVRIQAMVRAAFAETTGRAQAASAGAHDESLASAVEYICAGAQRHSLDSKSFAAALLRSTDLSSSAAEVLVNEYAVAAPQGGASSSGSGGKTPAASPTAAAALHHSQHIAVPERAPELIGMDWALGVPVQSSASTAVGRPFVNLHFRAAPAGDAAAAVSGVGGVSAGSVEMTLPQLKAFEAALRDAQYALERA